MTDARIRSRKWLSAALVVVAVVLVAFVVNWLFFLSRYDSLTWMLTPPPRIDDVSYSRVDSAPEGSEQYRRLVERYGGPQASDRRWPLPFAIDRSARACQDSPWLLFVHDYSGKVHLYKLNSGCA
ncbi:hypothetical protein ACIBCD_11460 [Nocardia brasiliensis]|uniref:hypothetical protein n=1 Tax=Nocardia brasiliensis TaxID=37326 RepID=UPI0024575BFD|nr:hypothetical protein [Nocardia brasiliensis]